ncbi:MAG: hypothetical protein K0U93_08295 [Gammaproteobacteria bacterium]|nr:hypothetical protein [Gammaproteobacteria bacterium]
MSGHRALSSIDAALSQARSAIAKVETEIASVTQRTLAGQQALAVDYKELAHVRVDRLSDPALDQRLDEAERRIVEFLAERTRVLAEHNAQVQSHEEGIARLELTRRTQAERVESAAGDVDEAEAATQARLDLVPAYRAQREKAEAAERKAMHADEKALRSEEEHENKGEAYRADPLFMYLWDRGFGTATYAGSGLFRWLDGWVAKFIGFADARANYARLSDIPVRLREHANGLKSEAENEYGFLRDLDESAQAEDGIPQLVTVLKSAQAELDAIDAQIVEAGDALQLALVERGKFATGDDEYTTRAVEFLANEFQRADLQQLRHDALSTPYPDDDLIISRMLTREHERRQLESSLDELRATIGRHQQRLSELEGLRADFKRSRFDRAGSMFADDRMIGMLLGQFLNGLLDRGMLWKILREQQRYSPRRSNPTFGSGGFGRGTVWNGGIGDIGDIGDILGGSVRRGSGRGRPTLGGSGGGGGFRTGGGF